MPPAIPRPETARLLSRRFALAWSFLLLSAALGVGLRLAVVSPLPGVNYAFLLHTHSHLAFLGWVFNAFVVASLRHFIPPEEARSYDGCWWALQVGVAGMLLTFPFQGYAAASIGFATLHTGAAALFAVKLWRHNRAVPAARVHLRTALGFMLLSGVGPLALGPLAALGLRESPAYTLAIYFYLHCQSNGWFVFFLQALCLQRQHEAGYPWDGDRAVRAARWLAAGGVLTFALAVLWIRPPAWVHGLALLGGLMQLAGCLELVRSARGAARTGAGLTALERLAAGALFLKHALQLVAAMPALSAVTGDRFVAIAFLHLIFLGIVTPALIAWGFAHSWWSPNRKRPALALFLAGAAATEILLVLPTAAGFVGLTPGLPLPPALLASAGLTFAGLALLGIPRAPARPAQPA